MVVDLVDVVDVDVVAVDDDVVVVVVVIVVVVVVVVVDVVVVFGWGGKEGTKQLPQKRTAPLCPNSVPTSSSKKYSSKPHGVFKFLEKEKERHRFVE